GRGGARGGGLRLRPGDRRERALLPARAVRSEALRSADGGLRVAPSALARRVGRVPERAPPLGAALHGDAAARLLPPPDGGGDPRRQGLPRVLRAPPRLATGA